MQRQFVFTHSLSAGHGIPGEGFARITHAYRQRHAEGEYAVLRLKGAVIKGSIEIKSSDT